MKKVILKGVLAIGLLPLFLVANSASADFISRTFSCPGNGRGVLPPGSNVTISDITLSTSADQKVSLKFMPGNLIIMSVFMKANESVVSNFQGNVEGDNDQALKLDCSGTEATVTVTIVGSGSL